MVRASGIYVNSDLLSSAMYDAVIIQSKVM